MSQTERIKKKLSLIKVKSGEKNMRAKLLKDYAFKNFDLDKGTAKLEFDAPTDMLVFQDRPGIKAFSIEWSDLASKSNWNNLFGKAANTAGNAVNAVGMDISVRPIPCCIPSPVETVQLLVLLIVPFSNFTKPPLTFGCSSLTLIS